MIALHLTAPRITGDATCIVAATTIDGSAARGIWTKGNSTNSTGDFILVANGCDANQRGICFGAATGLETSHNFAFNNTLTRSAALGVDAQSVGPENYCGQQYATANTADIGGVTGAVFFNSPSSAVTVPAAALTIAASSPGTSAIPATSASTRLATSAG